MAPSSPNLSGALCDFITPDQLSQDRCAEEKDSRIMLQEPACRKVQGDVHTCPTSSPSPAMQSSRSEGCLSHPYQPPLQKQKPAQRTPFWETSDSLCARHKGWSRLKGICPYAWQCPHIGPSDPYGCHMFHTVSLSAWFSLPWGKRHLI